MNNILQYSDYSDHSDYSDLIILKNVRPNNNAISIPYLSPKNTSKYSV